jgi:hypothetical protein
VFLGTFIEGLFRSNVIDTIGRIGEKELDFLSFEETLKR